MVIPGLLQCPCGDDRVSTAVREWAASLDVPSRIVDANGVVVTLIPPGEYSRGLRHEQVELLLKMNEYARPEFFDSERSNHRVRITRPFFLGVYEVTQDLFERVMGGFNPGRFARHGQRSDDVTDIDTSRWPVHDLSWFDAIEFCNRLSVCAGIPQYYAIEGVCRFGCGITSAEVTVMGGSGYRLPTDAEWEYACRAGTDTLWHFGNVLTADMANVYLGGDDGAVARPTTVGSYAPNAFGLHDMHGNVEEWCFDRFDWCSYSRFQDGVAVDPSNTAICEDEDQRICRGGQWQGWTNSYSACRSSDTPLTRGGKGLRIARNPSEVDLS